MRKDELFEISGQKKVEKLVKEQAEKEQPEKRLVQKLLENEQKEQAEDLHKREIINLLKGTRHLDKITEEEKDEAFIIL